MTTQALEPCPFCGYDMSAEEDCAYQKSGFIGAQTPVWAVTCAGTDCNASVECTSAERAIAAWNRRQSLAAGGDPKPAQVDECMKLAIIVSDATAMIHTGAELHRVVRVFDLPPEVGAYIEKANEGSYTYGIARNCR